MAAESDASNDKMGISFLFIPTHVVKDMKSEELGYFLNMERDSKEAIRANPAQAEKITTELAVEQSNYVDMFQRTRAVADRNGLTRPNVHWADINDCEGGMQNGKEMVRYGSSVINSLSSAARDFIAAHEVAHTMPENRTMMVIGQRGRSELLADEFAARQPGFTIEAAKEALNALKDVVDHEGNHLPTEARLQNMKRAQDEFNAKQGKKIAAAELPSPIPSHLEGQLANISSSLSLHRQEGTRLDNDLLVSSIATPALERVPGKDNYLG